MPEEAADARVECASATHFTDDAHVSASAPTFEGASCVLLPRKRRRISDFLAANQQAKPPVDTTDTLDKSDKMLLPEIVQHAQLLAGCNLTMDVCTDDAGHNSHCNKRRSPSRPFQSTYDYAGECLLINAPFDDLSSFLHHWKK